MEIALRGLRIIWGALVASVVLYAAIGEIVTRRELSPNLAAFKLVVAISLVTVVLIFLMRRFTANTLTALRTQPADNHTVSRWRGSCIATLALCEVIALYGFVLRMEGFSLLQVLPFYIAGLLLLLFFAPRRPGLPDVATG